MVNLIKNALRGGPFDNWGAMIFLRVKLFSIPSLIVHNLFRPDKKQNIFAQLSNTKQFFSLFIFIWFSAHHFKFSRCHHIYIAFAPLYLIKKAIVYNWSCLNNFNFDVHVRSEPWTDTVTKQKASEGSQTFLKVFYFITI